MHLIYIHGANASSTSFNYIRKHLPYPELLIDYHSHAGFAHNLAQMNGKIKKLKQVFFIAHSLGGVYALHLAHMYPTKVVGGITLSTPYGGSQEADMMSWFMPHNQLIKDIRPQSDVMASLTTMSVPANWHNVISRTGASPFIRKDNDGVVTVDSMMHLADRMNIIEVDFNHFEVVLSDQVVSLISDQISQLK